MKIGDKVHCTRYVERSRQGINIMDFTPFDSIVDLELIGEIPSTFKNLADVPSKAVVYYDTDKKDNVVIPYDEFTDATIDKFKTVEKEFDGIYVGTTRLTTKLTATYETPPYGEDYIRFESECVKKFAIVYYANNRKRLVPIEYLRRSEE